MDYEQILFGLQPLLNIKTSADFPCSPLYLESQLTILDQLAVQLRSENNRDVIRETGLLDQLLRVINLFLDSAFHEDHNKSEYFALSSELIRCIANALVDNDLNREVFWGKDINKKNLFIDYYAGRILGIEYDEDLFQVMKTRTIILCLNLCMDNPSYCSRMSISIGLLLLKFLISLKKTLLEDENTLAISSGFTMLSLFSENGLRVDLRYLVDLSEFLLNVSTITESISTDDENNSTNIEDADNITGEDEEDKEEESYVHDLLQSITRCVFGLTADEKLDLSDEVLTSQLQRNMFNCLSIIHSKAFPNKLIISREIFSSIGNISSNKSYSNIPEIDFCIDRIKSSAASYPIAAAMIVLSNSIDGPEKVDFLNSKIGYSEIVHACTNFTDPIQYQGFLDLFRKLLKMDVILLTSKENLYALSDVITLCHDQCKYYQGLSPLLDRLLEKLLAVLGAGQILDILERNFRFEEAIERNVTITSLALEKLSKRHSSKTNATLVRLVEKLIAYLREKRENLLSEPLLAFHVTRALGVFITEAVKTDALFIQESLIDTLSSILDQILTLKESKESAHQAIFNNGRYIAGLVISNKEKFVENDINSVSSKYF